MDTLVNKVSEGIEKGAASVKNVLDDITTDITYNPQAETQIGRSISDRYNNNTNKNIYALSNTLFKNFKKCCHIVTII